MGLERQKCLSVRMIIRGCPAVGSEQCKPSCCALRLLRLSHTVYLVLHSTTLRDNISR